MFIESRLVKSTYQTHKSRLRVHALGFLPITYSPLVLACNLAPMFINSNRIIITRHRNILYIRHHHLQFHYYQDFLQSRINILPTLL